MPRRGQVAMNDLRADVDPRAPLAIARPAPRGEHCRNCGAELYGEFCYACGQPRVSWVRHLRELSEDFVENVLNIDGRFLRTLVTLFFRPGRMTVDYLAGARGRYASPFRMFFVLCALAFLLLHLNVNFSDEIGEDPVSLAIETASTEEAVDRALAEARVARAPNGTTAGAAAASERAAGNEDESDNDLSGLERKAERRKQWIRKRDAAIAAGAPVPPDPSVPTLQFGGDRPWHATENPIRIDGAPDWLLGWLNARAGRMQRAVTTLRSDPQPIIAAIFAKLPLALLVVMPVFAAVLKIVHWPRHRLYTEHLVVALHSHAFLFLALILISLVSLLPVPEAPASWLGAALSTLIETFDAALLLWVPVYLLLMQKRVYGGRWWRTLVEFAITATIYVFLLTLAIAFGAIAGLMSL
jgi:hypothetical protein